MRPLLLPALIYGAATLCVTWPLARAAADHLYVPTPVFPAWIADALLVSWILSWDVRALGSHPLGLFDPPVFHPAPQMLAHSEHLLGDLPLFAPVFVATGNPILAVNVMSGVSYFLAGLTMHTLARCWTGSTAAAYVAGLAFAFAPGRAAGPQSPHLLQVQYLPLVLLYLDRTATTGALRAALLTAAFLVLQTLCSYYFGYAAFVVAGVYVISHVVIGGSRVDARAWRAMAVALGTALAIVAGVSVPYLRLAPSGAFTVDPAVAEASKRAAQLLLTPANVARGSLGWGTALLGLLGILGMVRGWRRDRRATVRRATLLLVAIAGFVLARARGGLFGGRVVPYDWLATVVPGFENTRVAARFLELCSVGACGLAAFGVSDLLAHSTRTARPRLVRGTVVAVALLAVLVPIWSVRPPSVVPIATREDLPAAYPWLARQGENGPLLELPLGSGPAAFVNGARAMYFSIFHRLPILNGHTGYLPPSYRFLSAYADALPAPEALQLLIDCTGLRWVLLHDVSPARLAAWDRLAEVRLRDTFARDAPGRDRLYEIRATPRPGCARHLFEPGVTAEGHPAELVRRWDGRIGVRDVADPAVASGESAVTITLENDSTETWPGTSVDPSRRFALAAEWVVEGRALEPGQRIPVPRDVAPGGRFAFHGWLRHPSRPGPHVLRIVAVQGDAVAEGLVWEHEILVTGP